ncbi:right-handed parallel beta-helix repeat-containing protein [Plantibacter sp. CFBP 8804]|uniref:right-handed parallel beta-helix repeat-containing protein n=1 Tax=Plantibacter sp. CFBP 8804 TaxID=2775270 RepID=UPI00178384A8|nr:right-handed parallel beta-helix repeat-containing protein [Plantibacter sp. CFBP 8804]MBD8518067.1 right-handed parallel beta-helix repeat-containing protein [Plantibacter sp. CFBP 8804]
MKLGPLAALSATVLVALAVVAGPAPSASAASTTIYTSPTGTGTACSAAAPCSITDAQVAARSALASSSEDVTVLLGGGTYRVSAPLNFGASDGGSPGRHVVWQNQTSTTPVITGATPVSGWTKFDGANNIYVADTPIGLDTRQLYVDGVRAPRASIPISKTDVTLTATGLTINNPALNYLSSLPQQDRIELNGTGAWTDRYSRVASISGTSVVMAQPGWDNNTWGWDTLQNGFHGPTLTLNNSLNFVRTAGQWYIDPVAGKLYYKPADGVDPGSLAVELPRLQSLVHIGGTYDAPVSNLTFQGIQFSGTSWLGPSSADGYTNQQNGTFSKGAYDYRPADAFTACNRGCAAFERSRNTWFQEPAAVQVSAASQVAFVKNTFTALGQTGLGIGMDANAHATGVGLGTSNITVSANTFTQLAGSGVVVGGIREDAHHPSDPKMIVRDILIQNNTVTKIGQDYKDNSGILTTYVTNARIVQNEVADVPYDGIDTGWGWGVNDPGGSPDYRNRGYYAFNPQYSTKTTLANNVVAYNLVHGTKKGFSDGGSIYNLSASPGTVYRNNYIYDLQSTIGLYLDEGSRYMSARYNVIQDAGQWIFANTNGNQGPNETKDNNADNNYHNRGEVWGLFNSTTNNTVTNDQAVSGPWPTTARVIMCEAGVAPGLRTPANANYSATSYPSCGAGGSHVAAPYQTTGTSATSSYFAQEGGDQFSISAAGADVWRGGAQTDDAFGAVYQDGVVRSGTTLSARVDAQNDTNPWAKTGLMIRNDMTKASSSPGYAILAVTPANGVVLEWDSNADGYLDKESKVAVETQRPISLRLVRSGTQVTAFYSIDGSSYRQIGSAVTLTGIAGAADGGIFSTSHDATRASTNFISDLQVSTGVAAPLSSFMTGGGEAAQSGTQLLLGANGNDVFKGGAQFDDGYGAVYVPGGLTTGKSVTTKVVSQAESSAWAKSGLMVKNSISSPGYSPGYAVLAVTPSNGVVLEWDSDGDGYIDSESKVALTTSRPIWLKLTRSGNQVTGYYSTDGSNFAAVGGAITLPGLATAPDAGVFSTSHDPSRFGVNEFTVPTVQ